jgi:large conductance mechanosensitive channel
MVGFALYGMANLFQTISKEPIIRHTKKCKYCRKNINEKVRLSSLPRHWISG